MPTSATQLQPSDKSRVSIMYRRFRPPNDTHDDQSHSKPDHLTATQYIADEEIDPASRKGAKAIRADCYTGNNRSWMVELTKPVRILQNAAKHSLIVAEEQERGQTAAIDCYLHRFPSAKDSAHVDSDVNE